MEDTKTTKSNTLKNKDSDSEFGSFDFVLMDIENLNKIIKDLKNYSDTENYEFDKFINKFYSKDKENHFK